VFVKIHRQKNREQSHELVPISVDDGEAKVLVSGNDFYSSPRLNPEARACMVDLEASQHALGQLRTLGRGIARTAVLQTSSAWPAYR